MKNRRWLILLAGLALVWIMAWGAISLFQRLTPTAERVEDLLQDTSLELLSGRDRTAHIDRVITMVDRLSLDERRALQRSGRMREWFEALDEPEQIRFVEATLPRGFRQMMQALNEMSTEERQRLVNRALRDLEREEEEEVSARIDEEQMQRIVEVGLEAFFEEASAETKMQVAPVIEQFQRRLQRVR